MRFGLDADKLLVWFACGERDLALAFADMEGYDIQMGKQSKGPRPIAFGGGRNDFTVSVPTLSEPSHISPGIYAYKLQKRPGAEARDSIRRARYRKSQSKVAS